MSAQFYKWTKWIIRLLLAAAFILAAISKLSSQPALIDMFREWGYSSTFCIFIGALELLGGVLLLVPKMSRMASIGLLIIMAGAAITHLIHDPLSEIVRPLIFSILLVGNVILSGRPDKIKTSDQSHP